MATSSARAMDNHSRTAHDHLNILNFHSCLLPRYAPFTVRSTYSGCMCISQPRGGFVYVLRIHGSKLGNPGSLQARASCTKYSPWFYDFPKSVSSKRVSRRPIVLFLIQAFWPCEPCHVFICWALVFQISCVPTNPGKQSTEHRRIFWNHGSQDEPGLLASVLDQEKTLYAQGAWKP